MEFKDLYHAEITKYKDKIDLLVITATPVETEAALFAFRPFEGENHLVRFYINDTYTLGVFGRYAAVHVQCNSMGSASRQGSALTTIDAIDTWKPKAVVMVGIAFGKDEKKQKLQDILVSEAVVPYEFERIGEVQKISRAYTAPSGSTLFERAKVLNRFSDGNVQVHYGKILSGEKVVDSQAFKYDLFNTYKEAIGGEMEGAGLFAACSRRGVSEWLLVKSICDWADGSKNKEVQKPAAETAVDFVRKLFISNSAFEKLGFTPLELSEEIKIVPGTLIQIEEFLNDIEHKLWRDSEEIRENVGILVQELCHNAFKHGGAKSCVLHSENRRISIKFDGVEFNLRNVCEDNLHRGGSHALSYILKNYFDTVEYDYKYLNGENLIYLNDISGQFMDFTVEGNCAVNISHGEYIEWNRELFINRHIEVPEQCDTIILNLRGTGSLRSRTSSGDNGIIREIISRVPENVKLKVRIKGGGMTRSFFSQYNNDDRITFEYF
jgi:nucleoside phosphorylase/anti-sigma regulatory factor (Ser/Thr protein kinase)